jgi:hypothetical protein
MSPRLALPLLLSALLALAGCDSEEATDDTLCNSGFSGFLIADVDGAPFEAECLSAAVQSDVLTVFGSTVTDTPEGRIQRRVDLVVVDVHRGTFVVGGPAEASYSVTNLDDGDDPDNRVYAGVSGEVVITEAAGVSPAGTFDFTAGDGAGTVEVTAGRFELYE